MSRSIRRAMIDRDHQQLSLVRQCILLDVSRASVYYRPVPTGAEDLELMALMDRQYLKTPFYGSRKMKAWLLQQGYLVSRKRVRRLMRLMGLEAIYRRPNTSKPAPGHRIFPYLLKGVEVNRVDQVWAADITYIPMAKGFLYLVAIMDWHSRHVLAWKLSNTMDTSFCVAALEEALGKGRPEIFNTDQGSQFTSEAFTQTLQEQRVQVSMDGKGRYLDNIKFNANFQLKTDEIEVSESGDALPHDPMAVKAFRDAYAGNIHTFLDNLIEQLTLARELLTESGSCFVQIGYENVHEVACLMNEVFGKENHVATIPYITATNQSTRMIPQIGNWILWFAKNKEVSKYNQLYAGNTRKEIIDLMNQRFIRYETPGKKDQRLDQKQIEKPESLPRESKIYDIRPLTANAHGVENANTQPFKLGQKEYKCPQGQQWRVNHEGLRKLAEMNRLSEGSSGQLYWKRYEDEIPGRTLIAKWEDAGRIQDKRYIVQSPDRTVERCILMTTNPGDLVLDPTCGSGTTAAMSEKWGRRWITIDTSRVAIAVARQRLATSRFDYFLLQDSEAGAKREAELLGAKPLIPSGTKNVQKGFVYPRIPRISAATLAYGIEEYIYLVDQPEQDPKKVRVCSSFTVESDSRANALRTDEDAPENHHDAQTRENILEALPVAGIRFGNDRWQLTDLEPYPNSDMISHTASLREEKSGEKLQVAIYIAAEDVATSPNHIRQAAMPVPNMNTTPKRDALLIIAFGYEAPATAGEYQQMGNVRIIRAEANRDFMIQGLKNSTEDNSFVVVGEPDVEFRPAPNGQLELEVRGIDTYDPRQNSVRSGSVRDIHCIMTDTDYDGLSFRVRRINFPNQTGDRQLERMKRGPAAAHRRPEVEPAPDRGDHPIRPAQERRGSGQGHRQGRDGDDEGDKHRKGEVNMERSKTTEQGVVLTESGNEPGVI